jgi:CTP:molybdopterin cytidylyltransferase MocA
MGHRPKCLLELGGMPLIQRALTSLANAGIDAVVVVLGHHADRIGRAIDTAVVTVVHNPSPGDGLVSSQRIGPAALTQELDAVHAVHRLLADQPLITEAEIGALIDAWEHRPEGVALVYPEVDGERGNPLVMSAAVRRQILEGEATLGCRTWQGRHAEQVMPHRTHNRAYRIDIDSPADRRLRHALPVTHTRDQVVFDAAAAHRTHHEAVVTQGHRGTG